MYFKLRQYVRSYTGKSAPHWFQNPNLLLEVDVESTSLISLENEDVCILISGIQPSLTHNVKVIIQVRLK